MLQAASGQRFMLLLLLLIEYLHFVPYYAIGASSRSAGKKYGDGCSGAGSGGEGCQRTWIGDLGVKPCEQGEIKDRDIIFKGLDSSVVDGNEMGFLEADLVVFSDAEN